MQLYIGNKNYSSWSLRAWLLMRQSGIEFAERPLRLDWSEGSPFKNTLLALAPTGRVPLLVEDDGFVVWDSLAIAEYLAERFPEKRLWSADRRQRARARSVCAEMHSGFTALRNRCPMNIEASLPAVGARCRDEWPEVTADLRRIDAMWSEALAESGGPFLFGAFSIADAFYAPVCARIRTYALPVGERALA
jgi:glutathione S-transferase